LEMSGQRVGEGGREGAALEHTVCMAR